MTGKKAARLQISENGFVFDPQSGSTYSLNAAGIEIIHLLRAGKSREQAAAHLSKRYGLDASTAKGDVDDFLISLKEVDLA